MEIGTYVNSFPVTFEKSSFEVAEVTRERYPSLKELRLKLKSCTVYAVDDKVYGFGPNPMELDPFGFTRLEVEIREIPKLTTAIIRDGISRHVTKLGYELEYGFANRVFDRSNPIPILVKEIQLFKGFEFRPLYLFDKQEQQIFFSVIIDLRHKLELEGRSCSYGKVNQYVTEKYDEDVAHQTIMDIRFKTGDLTPHGRRNPEASRVRLRNVLEFVTKFENVELYNGSMMMISKEPIRIIGDE